MKQKTIRPKKKGYRNQRKSELGESYFCCSQNGYLFHNFIELYNFSNDDDFFALNDDLSLDINP